MYIYMCGHDLERVSGSEASQETAQASFLLKQVPNDTSLIRLASNRFTNRLRSRPPDSKESHSARNSQSRSASGCRSSADEDEETPVLVAQSAREQRRASASADHSEGSACVCFFLKRQYRDSHFEQHTKSIEGHALYVVSSLSGFFFFWGGVGKHDGE